MTFEPQPAGPTFARCALRGARAGPKRTYGDIYIYINIYTWNLKFAQLVTELASLAINIYTRNLKFAQLVTELASLAIIIYFYTCKGSFVHTQRVNAHLILFNAHWFAFTLSRRECALSQSGLKPVWLNPLREVV